MEHHTPERVHRLMSIEVGPKAAQPALAEQFEVLRTNPDMAAERERAAPYLDAEPHKTLAFIAEMEMGGREGDEHVTYSCPMHPEVVSDEPGHCPECGMKLLPSHLIAEASGHVDDPHTHDHGRHEHHGQSHEGHDRAAGDGIEWEDDMVEINRLTTPSNMRWKLIDTATGAENAAIDWRFRVGDRVKIRLLNEMAGDHPMHHPSIYTAQGAS